MGGWRGEKTVNGGEWLCPTANTIPAAAIAITAATTTIGLSLPSMPALPQRFKRTMQQCKLLSRSLGVSEITAFNDATGAAADLLCKDTQLQELLTLMS